MTDRLTKALRNQSMDDGFERAMIRLFKKARKYGDLEQQIRDDEMLLVCRWLSAAAIGYEALADTHAGNHGENAPGTTALRFESEIRRGLADAIGRREHRKPSVEEVPE